MVQPQAHSPQDLHFEKVVSDSATTRTWSWFRETLKSPKFIAAPMVRQSELAFRMMVRELGNCHLCFTPMINCKDILKGTNDFTSNDMDRPLIVQLCGNDPELLAAAAVKVQHRCDGIDLNLGCPQQCAQHGYFGAYLCDDPDLVMRCIQAMTQACTTTTITAKIRMLETHAETVAFALRLQAAGVSMITVHGRTRAQRKHVGSVDWDGIAAVKRALKIPVIGNGGVKTRAQAEEMMARYGCDGVMVASELLINPTLFSQPTPTTSPQTTTLNTDAAYSTLYHRFWVMKTYLSYAQKHPPPHPVYVRDHMETLVREYIASSPKYMDLESVIVHKAIIHHTQFEALYMLLLSRLLANLCGSSSSIIPQELRIGAWSVDPTLPIWTLHQITHFQHPDNPPVFGDPLLDNSCSNPQDNDPIFTIFD